MRPYNGFKAEQIKPNVALPAGGYVVKIIKAEVATNDWGDRLMVYFDVAEGEHKGHFQDNYNNQTGEDKKWKGVYRLTVPKDDGSEKDGWSKRTFNNLMGAVEDSNPGYHWDWNEAGLKGKIVGILFRDKEWEYNGRTGWTTEACSATSADTIRDNKFTFPRAKPLQTSNTPAVGFSDASNTEDDDDCPF